MRRPPFKIDGRTGQLRWQGIDGREHVKAGRLTFLSQVWAEGVISGTGRAYEVRLSSDHPWHRLEATPDEMRRECSGHANRVQARAGLSLVERCDRVRVTRVMRGLDVFT